MAFRVTGSRPLGFLESPPGILLVKRYPKTYKSKELGKERERDNRSVCQALRRATESQPSGKGEVNPVVFSSSTTILGDIGVRIRKGERVTVILCDSCGSQRGDLVSTFRLGRSQPECILLVDNNTGDVRVIIRKEE